MSGALILGGTGGVIALNSDGEGDAARNLGIVTTVYLAAAAPVVGVGGGSARKHPAVHGSSGLRIVSWIGYGLALVDATFLVALSFDEEISNAHIASVGLLGALSAVGLAVDAHVSADEAERLAAQMPPAASFTLSPVVGALPAYGVSDERVPWAGVRGTF